MTSQRKPKLISAVYDNGGETFDRYTVVLRIDEGRGLKGCIGLSHNPNSPQGFSQYTTCQAGSHLGKKIGWSRLPPEIRAHIKRRLA